jgi:pyrroline-5-carboxylate reductase
MPQIDEPLVLVGAGKMGGALLAGWLGTEADPGAGLAPEQIFLRDPNPPEEMAQLIAERGCALNHPIEDIEAARPRIVVLAVKPQIMDAVLPDLRPLVKPGTLFLSIAAGVSLEKLSEMLGGGAAIVRAMPNTPASIGMGVTAVIGNSLVTEEDRKVCDTLLSAVGAVVWLSEETQMDAVTALSGSGPAYIFALAECMAAAGEALGLEADLATQLARATVAGSGAMLAQSEEEAATLRQNVTSPGGTTAAALDVLMGAEGLSALMRKAMTAARDRSRELAS